MAAKRRKKRKKRTTTEATKATDLRANDYTDGKNAFLELWSQDPLLWRCAFLMIGHINTTAADLARALKKRGKLAGWPGHVLYVRLPFMDETNLRYEKASSCARGCRPKG
jgi:hypothetical protein